MNDAHQRLRIVAASPSKPGDLIVEDGDGNRRLFIGSAGTLSRGSLNPDFFAALLERQRWEPIDDDRWYTLDELKQNFVPGQREVERTGPRRLVPAIGGRGAR